MRGPKQIRLELSEPVARYVLALLDVDDYEHSPNDYETAKLRCSIEQQLTRAQQQAPQTGGPMPTDVTTKMSARSSSNRRLLSPCRPLEQILTVIEQLHACYDYCAAWKEPAQQDDRADDIKTQDDEASGSGISRFVGNPVQIAAKLVKNRSMGSPKLTSATIPRRRGSST